MAGHPKGIFEIYKGDDGQWYWRLKAANNRTIAIGGEGFTTKQAAVHGIYAVGKYVMKQVQGGRGKHLDICEIDDCEHETMFPRPRREFEIVMANEDAPGGQVVRDAALAAEMEADPVFIPGPATPPAPPAPPVKAPAKKVTKKKATKKTPTKKKVTKKKVVKKVDTDVSATEHLKIEAVDTGVRAGGVLPDPLSTPEGRRVIGPGPDLPDNRVIGPGTNLSADDFAKKQLEALNAGEAVILPARVPVPKTGDPVVDSLLKDDE